MGRLYANKEARERLAVKSYMCFGLRCRWKKIADKAGWDLSKIEEELDRVIENKKQTLEDKNGSKGNDTVSSDVAKEEPGGDKAR